MPLKVLASVFRQTVVNRDSKLLSTITQRRAHLYAASVAVSVDGWFRRGQSFPEPTPTAQCAKGNVENYPENSCLCFRRYLHGERRDGQVEVTSHKIEKTLFSS